MSEVSTLPNSVAVQDTPSPRESPDPSPKGSPVAKSGKKKVLPPHWERVKSEQHGRHYYWNKETGKTTWKFPEDEAKEHYKVVRSHDYMNVEISPKKRPVLSESPEKHVPIATTAELPNNNSSHEHKPNTAQMSNGHTAVNECNSGSPGQESSGSQSVPQPKVANYVNVEIRSSGSSVSREPSTPVSPVPTDSRLPFTHTDSDRSSPISPTPPLPNRNYSGSEHSPTPPLPIRNYSESDVSLSPPPPLPDRGYESTSPPRKVDHFFPEDPTEHTGPEGQRSLQNGGGSEDNQRTIVKHKISVQGHEYAVVERGMGSQEEEPSSESILSPPPLPLRAHQRLAQDAEEAGYTEVAERNRAYVEVDTQYGSDHRISRQSPKPVAYAVVDLNREDRSTISEPTSSKKVLIPPRPRPYEVPTGSMENLADAGYEQIRESQEQPNATSEDGYSRVKRNSLQSFQRTSSQEKPDTQRRSYKEVYTLPTLAKDSGANPLTRRDSPSTGRDSPFSQDSVFDSDQRYDLPSNSARLQRLNVTLTRGSTPNLSGYSRLGDYSKEAILLRSGVTLRRYGQLDSVSSLKSRPEEKSEESCSGSDQDDSLEPVHKAIKSLESSLGVSADDLSGPPMEMVRASDGPPTWTKMQRRPHAYERISDSPENGFESSNQKAEKCHQTMPSLEMDWDETEFSDTKTGMARMKELSEANRSSSQPNLLRDSDVQFPHLKQPPRVSDEAFQLRKNRLMSHKYEKVESGEGPPVLVHSTESVGDVNALNSAVKESWLEGDQGAGLPKGWRSLKDDNERLYYWHVPTGRTQYEKPTGEEVKRMSLSVDDQISVGKGSPGERGRKRRPHPTFKARLIDSMDVEESELVQGQCVKVVHSCINKLTSEPDTSTSSDKDKTVFLQIHNANLRWLDPETSTPTLTQPINKIRVWGIGLENDKDFGYVARNLNTKKYQCHIFRCERPARAVARALLEAHQRERQQKRARKALQKEESVTSSGEQTTDPANRPTPTPLEQRSQTAHSLSPLAQSDAYERVTCQYMGSCDVFQSQGMQVVNEAVGKLCAEGGPQLVEVTVDVATSHIRILEAKTEKVIGEHRVRFLCFLGIAKDDRFCGYVLDNGSKNDVKQLKFHGFYMAPNTDKLCLAIHKACQARYKRVLESNPDARKHHKEEHTPPPPSKAKSTPNLFDRLGSLKKTKKPLVEEDNTLHHNFVVQYLGCQGVSKAEGLDTVRVPLQQMALPKTQDPTIPPFLVEFGVSPGGITLSDPLKKVFNKKMFAVKTITYVVRVRNYFAFISKDSGKFNCHVFLENEVDAGTIVSTVEETLVPDSLKSPTK